MPRKNPPTPTQRTQSRTGEAAQKNQLGLQIHAAVDPNVMNPASLKLIRMGQPSFVRSNLSPDCAARMRWYMPTARKMRLRAIQYKAHGWRHGSTIVNNRAVVKSDTPRGAGGLMSWIASKAVRHWFRRRAQARLCQQFRTTRLLHPRCLVRGCIGGLAPTQIQPWIRHSRELKNARL